MPATEGAAGAPLQEVVFRENEASGVRIDIPCLFLLAGFLMEAIIDGIGQFPVIFFFVLIALAGINSIH